MGFYYRNSKKIFVDAGYKVELKLVPFARSIKGTESGLFDAVIMANKGHSDKLRLSNERSGVLKQYFYVKKGNLWNYNGVKSLENIVVASVIGYNYSVYDAVYQNYLNNYKNDPGRVIFIGGHNPHDKVFRAIKNGRITTFNEDSTLADYIIYNDLSLSSDDFEIAGSLGENNQYMGFSPKLKNPDKYIKVFDDGIVKMRKDGSLKTILDSYGVVDWE